MLAGSLVLLSSKTHTNRVRKPRKKKEAVEDEDGATKYPKLSSSCPTSLSCHPQQICSIQASLASQDGCPNVAPHKAYEFWTISL